jgi:hypothetical protein
VHEHVYEKRIIYPGSELEMWPGIENFLGFAEPPLVMVICCRHLVSIHSNKRLITAELTAQEIKN